MKNSCLNCKNRTILCHKNCSEYKEYLNELDKIKKAKKLERLLKPHRK